MRVAIVGASPKPDRYAHKAMNALLEHGHEVILVNPRYPEIGGRKVVPDLTVLDPGSIDQITLYVGPDRSEEMAEAIIALHPQRVIFNPGAENAGLADTLQSAGIKTEEACTLVLLATGAFS